MVAEITRGLPVNQMDVVAIEDWLEQMALKGYFLEDIVLRWWHFKIMEPKEVRYRLDLGVEKKGLIDPVKKEDYEALGWHYIYTHKGSYHIFMADDPETEELHTDPAVESMTLKKWEKNLVVLLALFIYGGIISGLGTSSSPLEFMTFIKYPFLSLTGAYVWVIFGYLLLWALILRTGLTLRKVHILRKSLAEGKDIRYDSGTRIRKKYNQRWSILFFIIILLLIISMFSSCASGGSGDAVLLEKGLPILQDIETGEVVLLEDPSWSGHGTKVWNYKNPLLQEHYEYYQEGIINKEINSETANSSNSSKLTVSFYNMRLGSMAEPLSREIAKKYREENGDGNQFTGAVNDTPYTCLVSENGQKRMIIAVIEKKVIALEYQGEEPFTERIGTLEIFATAQRVGR